MVEKLEKKYPFLDDLLKELDKFKEKYLFKNDGLFIKQSVHGLLFGYQDQLLADLLDVAKLFHKDLGISDIFNFSVSHSYNPLGLDHVSVM